METIRPLKARDFHAAEGTEDWRVIGDGACAFFRTESFAQSARLVQSISSIRAIQDHPPDLDVRRDGVTVRLLSVSDDYYGMGERDLELAREISAVARDLGLAADPSAVQNLLVIPGAPAGVDVMPFWRAALGYMPRPDSPEEDLVDPHDRSPGLWFETMDEPRGDGGGSIHLAVWVPIEQAEARVAAALAAGGHVVRAVPPTWWTLADAAGNEVDVSTVAGRD